MKRFLVATLLVAGSTAAQSADLAVKAPYYKAPVAQVYDWTGFYIGVNVGVGVGQNKITEFSGPNAQVLANIAPVGAVGGGQIGYNYQFGHWLVGTETDFQGITKPDGSQCPVPTCTQSGQRLDWFGTVRGRLGYVTGPVLSYVTGGFAYGDVKTSQLQTINGIPGTLFSSDRTKSGWTWGTGVEAALSGNWTGKIEYLYVDLGNTFDNFQRPISSEIREHIFRAGVNYRFGGNGGPIALAPAANWSGFYLGGNGGSGLARDKTQQTIAAPFAVFDSFPEQPRGFIGGVQAGYNWQAANWVFGLEADFQGSSQRDDRSCFATCNAINSLRDDQKLPWLGTVRGRIGYDIGQTLFYATAGLAYGQVKTTITETFGPVTNVKTLDHTKTGWTAGAGMESPFEFLGWFGKNWTAKTEYLYVDLGSASDSFSTQLSPFGGLTIPVAHTFSSSVHEHIFRTGLNYHLNQPVVAKY